ncbi:MAG: hypothetical protein WAV87_05725 [Trichococcus flocculiformis]|jgi:uncharacterized membrane protein YczE|uniref:YitT family protein n=1 Tax=bioreactor metagenome TaxID=1076179 RepID=A0A644Y7Z9_9ZZZZ|nr:hypothetical protein [uncultured Trichococcus sp.]MBP6231543.1 hypothetical protein [Paludibacteraceae bacterium]
MKNKFNLTSLFRFFLLLFGSLVMGFGVSLSISTGYGSDSLSWVWQGISLHTNLTLNQSNMIITLLMLIPPLLYDRAQLGIGSILQPYIVGATAEYTLNQGLSNPGNFLFLIMGILLLGIGAGIYTSANLGKVPYDACVFWISKVTKNSIGLIRSLGDLCLFIIAWLLNQHLIIGPLISVFLIGYILNTTYNLINKFLQKSK